MIENGWHDFATVDDLTHLGKVYSEPNAGRGLVFHSAEGWLLGSLSRIKGTDRDSQGRYIAYHAASWIGFVRLSGQLIQHYRCGDSTWTSGNRRANTTLWAYEFEGLAGTPLTEPQVETGLRIIADFEAETGRHVQRNFDMGAGPDGDEDANNLWEHREVWDWSTPNAGPTACPSGRMAPLYLALARRNNEAQEADMDEQRVREIVYEIMASSEDARVARFHEYVAERLAAISRAADLDTTLDELRAMNSVRGGRTK